MRLRDLRGQLLEMKMSWPEIKTESGVIAMESMEPIMWFQGIAATQWEITISYSVSLTLLRATATL